MEKKIKTEIYLDELGYRNAITEADQVQWYWEQKARQFKSKGHVTSFFIGTIKRYGQILEKYQAYELIAFLKSKVSDEQLSNSEIRKLQTQANAALEMVKFEDWHKNEKIRRFLTTIQSYN